MNNENTLKIMGNNIKKLRESFGMSQEALAFQAGYKSRTSINKIELGKTDLSQTMIIKLAKILNTTPANIMGWEEDSNSVDYLLGAEQKETSINKDERDIETNPDIRLIARAGKKLTKEQAEQLRKYAEFMFPEAFEE